MTDQQLSGFIAIVGRPNVGKSTLINQLIGQKVSIVCRKRQTTRHNVLGIKTQDNQQMIFVDTPGIHQEQSSHRLNRFMNHQATQALEDVEAVVWMIDYQWRQADEVILEQLQQNTRDCPLVLVINKIDQLADKAEVLPLIEYCQSKMEFDQIIPISAHNTNSVKYLEQCLQSYLVEHPFFFPVEQSTDRSQRFQMAEMIREQLFSMLHKELPYGLTVYIERLEKTDQLWSIGAVIWVADANHKRMIIGKKGSKLKKVGQKARQAMEKHFNQKIYLELWVKVQENWYNKDEWLNQIDQQ